MGHDSCLDHGWVSDVNSRDQFDLLNTSQMFFFKKGSPTMIDLFQSSLQTFRCFFTIFPFPRDDFPNSIPFRTLFFGWHCDSLPLPCAPELPHHRGPGWISLSNGREDLEARSPVISRGYLSPLTEVEKKQLSGVPVYIFGVYNSNHITNRAHLVVDIMIGK